MNFLALPVMLIAGTLLLVKVLPILLVWMKLRRVPMGGERFEQVAEPEVPEDYRVIFREAEGNLGRLGFTRTHFVRYSPPPSSELGIEYCAVFLHGGQGARAAVQRRMVPGPGEGFDVAFTTRFSDGTVIRTIRRNADGVMPEPAQVDRLDVEAATAEELLALHLGHVSRCAAGRQSVWHGAEEDVRFSQQLCDATTQYWFDTGLLKRIAAQRYGVMTSAAAFRMALQSRNVCKAPPQPKTPPPDTPESFASRVSAHTLVYQRVRNAQQARGGPAWVWMLVTMLLSIGAFRLQMNLERVLILMLVLLVHEAGHLAGMAMFGYRDRRMLFLPFLGAIAMGKRDRVKPWQELLILLLGPLPGIVIGTGLLLVGLLWSYQPLLLEIGGMALILNLFNMLPILPLDGGRILECTLMARWPRARLAFQIVSILLLAGLGLAPGMTILMVPAALLGLALPTEIRLIRLVEQVRADRGEHQEEPARLRAIFRRMLASSAMLAAIPQRIALAQRADAMLTTVRPSVGLGVAGVLLFFAVWGMPIGAAVTAGVAAGLLGLDLTPALLESADTPDRKMEAYLSAATVAHATKKDDKAAEYFSQAEALADQTANPPASRARLGLRKALLIKDPAASRVAVERVLETATEESLGAAARGDLLMNVALFVDRFDTGEQRSFVQQALESYGRAGPGHEQSMAAACSRLSSMHAEQREWDDAITFANRALEMIGTATNDDFDVTCHYQISLSSLLCEAGRPTDAEVIVRAALSNEGASASTRWELQSQLAWIAAERGDFAAAEAILRPLLRKPPADTEDDRPDPHAFICANAAVDLCHIYLATGRSNDARAVWGAYAGEAWVPDDDEEIAEQEAAQSPGFWERRSRARVDVMKRFGRG